MARLRFGTAAGDDQQNLPGRGVGSVPVGAAAGPLSFKLHHLLRQPALVQAGSVRIRADRRLRRDLLGALPRDTYLAPGPTGHLFSRPVHLFHGLSWRSLSAQAATAPSHQVLPNDRRRRRRGWLVRGVGGPDALHILFRAALRPVSLRAVVHACTHARAESPGPSPLETVRPRRALV